MTHARLGPSAAGRWSHCTKSISFVEELIAAGTIPEYEPPSKYAAEGIELHTVLANAMDAISEILCRADWWRAEQRVEIPLGDERTTFGTADLIGYEHLMATAHVVDWKFGRGVPVEAVENIQLALYGWGLTKALQAEKYSVEHLQLTICQPRIKNAKLHGTTWNLTLAELERFLAPVFSAAAQIHAGTELAFYRSHATCRFCRGKPYCPEHQAEPSGPEILKLINQIEES